jgi:hypothetical protein
MKKILLIALVLSVVLITAPYLEKVTTTLDLKTGKSSQQHSILGVTYEVFTEMHNPKLCPTWNKPELFDGKTTITKSCYINFLNTESCSSQIVAYKEVYERGCST